MVRERWMHLLLLGFALSVVAHVVVMLRLWASEVPGRVVDGPPAVELSLQELPPAVEIVSEDIELPDPSPQVVGPVTTETDPVPNLSSELASDNPAVETFGAIEAPGSSARAEAARASGSAAAEAAAARASSGSAGAARASPTSSMCRARWSRRTGSTRPSRS